MTALAVGQTGVMFVVLLGVELALALTTPSPVPTWASVLVLVVASTYAAAGIVAWLRRPSSRMGALMLAGGLVWILTGLLDPAAPVLTAVGLITATLPLAVVVHLLHGFPSGRLRGRTSVATVLVGYFVCTVMQAPQYLFGQGPEGPSTVLQIEYLPDVAQAGIWAQWVVGSAVMVVTAIVLRRRWRSVPPARRAGVAPLLAYGIAAVLFVPTCGQLGEALLPAGDWTLTLVTAQLAVLAGVPIAFAVTMLRGGFARTLEVEELIGRLADGSGEREPLAVALAEVLGDPSSQLGFWLPEGGVYVDAAGAELRLDALGPGRTAVEAGVGGRRVGAIVFDSTLVADRGLVEAAARLIALAMERTQLTAELRESHEALRRSRARLVEAADVERRRLARDLHDGLQTRLVLLAMRADRLGEDPALPGSARAELGELEAELAAAIASLRTLVHGVLPPVLVDYGLFAAVEDLLDRVPLAFERSLRPGPARPAPAIEGTAFFVVSEAISNLLKHARASAARISLVQDGGRLLVEIEDDGVGGAAVTAGTGLRGIVDRVEALRGTVVLHSPPGGGTRLRAELPCEW
jgi:signal transduction histidine kinase